jgi:hypothetical protein
MTAPYPQYTFMQTGWMCPRCSRYYALSVSMCWYCVPPVTVTLGDTSGSLTVPAP